MKRLALGFPALLVCLAFLTGRAAAVCGFDVVLLMGQSNMVGHGIGPWTDPPELDAYAYRVHQLGRYGAADHRVIRAEQALQHWGWDDGTLRDRAGIGYTFGKRLAQRLPSDRHVLLVPAAHGATSIAQWDEHTQGSWDILPLYRDAIERTLYALSRQTTGCQNRLAAVLWHQGEADLAIALNPDRPGNLGLPALGAAMGYAAQLGGLVERLRRDLPGDWAFISGHLVPSLVPAGDPALMHIKYRFDQARRAVAAAYPRCAVVSTSGLTSNDETRGWGGPAHFDGPSIIILAERYFAAFLALQQ